MTAEQIALALLSMALRAAPALVEMVTGQSKQTLDERIARAHAAVGRPIDTTAADAAGDAELERIIRGDGS